MTDTSRSGIAWMLRKKGIKKWHRIINSYQHTPFLPQSTPVSLHKKQEGCCEAVVKRFSHVQHVRQVYFLENTGNFRFKLEKPYKILQNVEQLGVRTLKGGFRRRPELIKQRAQDLQSNYSPGLQTQSYGLFDKCERIQQELTEKLLCLMNVANEENTGSLMIDIGCGHGWSLTAPCLKGFCVTGVDLDFQALSVVQNKLYSNYLPFHRVQVVRTDVSNRLCFKENTFDVAISISFLQWLCVGKQSKNILKHFFQSLSYVLKPEGKAGIQFYPRNLNDVEKVVTSAQGYFEGVLVSDFPHLDRGRKLFLVLSNSK